jgi:hypothetical protein
MDAETATIELTADDLPFVEKVNKATDRWQDAEQKSKDRLIEVGKVLIEVHAHCEKRSYNFIAFLDKTDFGLHKSQAYNAIRLAKNPTLAEEFRKRDAERKRIEREQKKLALPAPDTEEPEEQPEDQEKPASAGNGVDAEASAAARKAMAEEPEPAPVPSDFDSVKHRFEKLCHEVNEAYAAYANAETAAFKFIEPAKPTAAQAKELLKTYEDVRDRYAYAYDFRDVERALQEIIRADERQKALIKQAKNPYKALEAARKHEQQSEMEGDRDDAKQDAKEAGDTWSDIKEEWEETWLTDNWNEERFLKNFKERWLENHGQEFPASNFAATPKKKAA